MTPISSHLMYSGAISQREEWKWRMRFGKEDGRFSLGYVALEMLVGQVKRTNWATGIFLYLKFRKDWTGDGTSL